MKIFNGDITQLNLGDLQGKLYNTFNCDLTFNKGKMLIAPRTIITTDTITNLGTPVGFKYFDTKWFTVAGTRVFRNDGTPRGVFEFDNVTNSPTNCSFSFSDIEVFNDNLVVTSNDRLLSKVTNGGNGTGVYTVRRTFGTSTATPAHMMAVYNQRLYFVDIRGQIFSYDTSWSGAVTTGTTHTFLVPNGQDIIWMRPHRTGLYIGTLDPNGGNSYVYDWDGVSINKWSARYEVSAQGILSGFVDSNGTLYIMTSDAELMQFTGAGFVPVGRLPIKRNLLYKATSILINDRFIHPNGMTAIDGRLSMLINNRENRTTTTAYQENIHSGIWEYDGKSLYHKQALSYYASSITDYGQITLDTVGGLANCSDIFETADNKKGNFLAGASYYSTSSTSTGIGYGIWTDDYFDELQKSGFFTTVQIRPENFEEMWQQITLLYTPLENFKYVVKYRTEREEHVDFDLTWTSTNTFTTTQTGISVGDEITIIQGKGSGRIAHVSEISFSTPNFTVTLDETITGVTGTARGRKENWTKCGEITNTVTKFSTEPIGQPDTLVEIKVAMLATGEVSIDEMILDSKKHQ